MDPQNGVGTRSVGALVKKVPNKKIFIIQWLVVLRRRTHDVLITKLKCLPGFDPPVYYCIAAKPFGTGESD